MALVKLNNRGVRSATTFGSITGLGSMVFIKKQTASSSATISFVDGTSDVVLDDTYKEYLFTFNNIHPATDGTGFEFNGSDDDSSHAYNITKTSTVFQAYHNEGDSVAELAYSSNDVIQDTGFQKLSDSLGNDNDQALCGYLYLFNPSSTTYVKHFIARTARVHNGDYANDMFIAGFFNTAADITAIQFKMGSGNCDSGTFKLYGIKDS